MPTLIELAELCEKASGPDRMVEWRIGEAISHPSFAREIEGVFPPFMVGSKFGLAVPHFTRSLDAAMSLVPEGWCLLLEVWDDGSEATLWDDRVNPVRLPSQRSVSSSPPLALVAAALRAREAAAKAREVQG